MPVGLPRPPPDSHVQNGEALNASKREADPKMNLPGGVLHKRPHVDDVVARSEVYTR